MLHPLTAREKKFLNRERENQRTAKAIQRGRESKNGTDCRNAQTAEKRQKSNNPFDARANWYSPVSDFAVVVFLFCSLAEGVEDFEH